MMKTIGKMVMYGDLMENPWGNMVIYHGISK